MSQELKRTIVLTANYYDRQLSPDTLAMYADDLSDLDPAACIDAYNRWRKNSANKTFPLPAQIRELVNPEQYVSVEALAREVAGRIIGAVTKYGWNNAKEAQVFIGREGWEVVKRNGGWMQLCQTTTTKSQTFLQAQLRDQLEGTFKYGIDTIENKIGALSQPRVSELDGCSDYLQLVSGKPDDGSDPKGAA